MERGIDFSEQQIKTLKAVVSEVVDDRIRANNVSLRQEIKDESRMTRDLLIQEIRASEVRLEKKFDQKLAVTEQRILDGVNDIVSGSILPQIDGHEQRLIKLETKIA